MAGERVLIVDDENDILELCKRILTARGYKVQTACTGHDALALAQQIHFDLLLTDIKMPEINGLEIARTLKASDPGVICIAMTGYGTIDMVLEALKLGIDEFILKPFTPEELSQTLSKATEKERLRKENFRLRSLIPLFEFNQTLLRTVDIEQVCQRLLEIAQAETKAALAVIYIRDHDQVTPYWHLPAAEQQRQALHPATTKLAQLTATAGRQLDLTELETKHPYFPLLQKLGVKTVIATPLNSKDTTLGVLILAQPEGRFAPSDRDFLAVLSSQAGIALENARLFTQIQESYQELQKLDDMKREFINIAAHELRTPLTVLMGYANVLEEDLTGRSKNFAANITRNALRLRSLIDDMLNLDYLENGIAVLTSAPLQLQEAMRDIMRDMSLLAEEKQLTITFDIPDNFPPIITDRQRFDLIVMNLFDNAIKFTPPGGKISLQARANGDSISIAISDTGIGIPEENMGRIFDRFYQVEPSLTREYGGIGLGLAIAQAMAELCGGKINVASKKNVGTTFTVTLPLDNTHLAGQKFKL